MNKFEYQSRGLFIDCFLFLWLLPATIICWLFYIIPLLMFEEIVFVQKLNTFTWEFKNHIDPTSWYDGMWAKWSGWSGPCVIIIREDIYSKPIKIETIRRHEIKHGDDQFFFGLFFYPAYLINTLWILFTNLFKKEKNKRHAYYENWFEIRARKAAGQRIMIPREEWPNGPNDYNPWL